MIQPHASAVYFQYCLPTSPHREESLVHHSLKKKANRQTAGQRKMQKHTTGLIFGSNLNLSVWLRMICEQLSPQQEPQIYLTTETDINNN